MSDKVQFYNETLKRHLGFEEVVEELSSYKGRHTELITVYVPSGQNIYSVVNQLEAEKSTAKNIKSTATRKNVIEALEKITRYLKGLKKTPEGWKKRE